MAIILIIMGNIITVPENVASGGLDTFSSWMTEGAQSYLPQKKLDSSAVQPEQFPAQIQVSPGKRKLRPLT